MRIGYLEEFVELSRQLNFTTAAKTLHITQPALSNHIRTLEKEARATLVTRKAGDRARLTPAGQRFLDMATSVIDVYRDALLDIEKLQAAIEGSIVIRSPRHEYSVPLLPYLFEFCKAYPRIDLVIRPWSEADGIDDVASGAVDLAYVGHGSAEILSVASELGISLVLYSYDEALLWMDKEHPFASKASISPQDLCGQSILIPANQRRGSWLTSIHGLAKTFAFDCRIVERYCDSLEDLVLNKATSETLMLCDKSILDLPAFSLREDRTQMRFEPPLRAPVAAGYRADTDNQALLLLVRFLQGKFENSEA